MKYFDPTAHHATVEITVDPPKIEITDSWKSPTPITEITGQVHFHRYRSGHYVDTITAPIKQNQELPYRELQVEGQTMFQATIDGEPTIIGKR